MDQTWKRNCTRGIMIVIRNIFIGIGLVLMVNQLKTINLSTDFLVSSSVLCTWVWIWEGPTTFVTYVNTVSFMSCKLKSNRTVIKKQQERRIGGEVRIKDSISFIERKRTQETNKFFFLPKINLLLQKPNKKSKNTKGKGSIW